MGCLLTLDTHAPDLPLLCSLAILRHDKANDNSQPHISNYKESSHHPSMVDSRKSGFSTSGEGSTASSRSNSMAFTGSVGIPARGSDLSMDSRRSLQPSSSFGSNDGNVAMRSTRSASTLAGEYPLAQGHYTAKSYQMHSRDEFLNAEIYIPRYVCICSRKTSRRKYLNSC